MDTKNPNIVIGSKIAAGRLDISESTLAKLRLYGGGPTYSKLGRRVVYRPDDLDEWVTRNRHQSTSDYATKSKDLP